MREQCSDFDEEGYRVFKSRIGWAALLGLIVGIGIAMGISMI